MQIFLSRSMIARWNAIERWLESTCATSSLGFRAPDAPARKSSVAKLPRLHFGELSFETEMVGCNYCSRWLDFPVCCGRAHRPRVHNRRRSINCDLRRNVDANRRHIRNVPASGLRTTILPRLSFLSARDGWWALWRLRIIISWREPLFAENVIKMRGFENGDWILYWIKYPSTFLRRSVKQGEKRGTIGGLKRSCCSSPRTWNSSRSRRSVNESSMQAELHARCMLRLHHRAIARFQREF